MKILLVRPPAPNFLARFHFLDSEPLELEYLLTAAAAGGHRASIYDGVIDKEPLRRVLRREKPDVLAVTGYITQQARMRSICGMAKALRPGIVTMAGRLRSSTAPE